jgi:surface protein
MATNDQFGISISASEHFVVIGAHNSGHASAGAAYIYSLESNGLATFKTKIPHGGGKDWFGRSLSISDRLLAVGAWGADPNSLGRAGIVDLFRLEDNGTAIYITRIFAPDATQGDNLGYSLSLSDNILSVGARNSSPNNVFQAGAVYIFDISAYRPNVPITDANLRTAVNLWFDNQAEANATYGHISDWNTSAVTDMSKAFRNRPTFNDDISGWDVGNVTTMTRMFSGASIFNQPIGSWNTSSVIHMYYTFDNAYAFNQDISNWDTSSVKDMAGMFDDAHSFNQNIGDWDTSSVQNMRYMFTKAYAFNQNIGDWNVSSVKYMTGMFDRASSFNQDIGDWNTSTVKEMDYLFQLASSFNQNLGNWDISNVTKMGSMFDSADALSINNKGNIHKSFSSNSNWTYDWAEYANTPPHSLILSESNFSENLPIGTIIGTLSAFDPDANATLFYSFHDLNNSSDNNLFELETNGTLRTKSAFDYETKASSFLITAQVKDELNAITEDHFTITLLNIVEDTDGDGTEDHYDLDDDGDGFSDIDEINFGSDPLDAKSMINQPPSGLYLNGSNIVENSPLNTIVGKLVAVDPDDGDTFSYTLVSGEGSGSNSFFTLSSDGILTTAYVFDHENAKEHSIRTRVEDQYGASLEKSFSLTIDNLYLPVAVTHPHTESANEVLFTGEILENGGEAPETFGIQLSSNITFENTDTLLASKITEKFFSITKRELALARTYYYRAFAINSEGTAYGAIMRLHKPGPDWWLDLSDETINGWIIDSWMGSMHPYPNQWAYHRRLGWIFTSPDGNEGYWLWRQENGWLWTNSSTWPFLWAHESAGWLYLLPVKNKALFYDYATGKLR